MSIRKKLIITLILVKYIYYYNLLIKNFNKVKISINIRYLDNNLIRKIVLLLNNNSQYKINYIWIINNIIISIATQYFYI